MYECEGTLAAEVRSRCRCSYNAGLLYTHAGIVIAHGTHPRRSGRPAEHLEEPVAALLPEGVRGPERRGHGVQLVHVRGAVDAEADEAEGGAGAWRPSARDHERARA